MKRGSGSRLGLVPSEVIALYRVHKSTHKVANILGTTPRTIMMLLRENGVKLPEKRSRTFELNDNAFDPNSLSPEKCYFAGLLMADGCINFKSRGQPTVAIAISGQDGEHLKEYKSFIGAGNPINIVAHRLGQRGRILTVSSKKMVDDLKFFGVTERKSHTAKTPDFLLDNRDWWRGVMCGDGWISLWRGFLNTGLCGSEHIVNQFAANVRRNLDVTAPITKCGASKNTFAIRFDGLSALKVIRLFFEDASPVLPRKGLAAKCALEIYRDVGPGYKNKRLPQGRSKLIISYAKELGIGTGSSREMARHLANSDSTSKAVSHPPGAGAKE